MRLDVHRRLREMEEALGVSGYGKCVQKLLALALLEGGAERVTERGVQGIDLEVEFGDGRRAALEVKTTMTSSASLAGSSPAASGDLRLGRKDADGLLSWEKKGYAPYLAVLGAALLDDWILARYVEGEVPIGTSFSPTRLRPLRDKELEARVGRTFPEVVARHAPAAARDGQGALDLLLRAHPRAGRA